MADMEIKMILNQAENEKYITNVFGNEQWVQVSGKKDLNGAEASFWCGLVKADQVKELFRDYAWDISPSSQGGPGFEGGRGGYSYYSNLLEDGYESLIFHREFYGAAQNYIEVSQEFILINNLRFDDKSKMYFAMYESGEAEEAVKYVDSNTILIKGKFLRKYSAAKQMALILFFDIRARVEGALKDYHLGDINKEYKDSGLYYGLWTGEDHISHATYSVMMGKKILMPLPVERCGYWPYESQDEVYEEFILGVDELGNEIKYTCNPEKLANYFGANLDAPLYLTPVFFKKEVLQKYISKPELYEIRDGYLSCGSLWGIEIDNHHKNCISAYLGDLGRDLPESERLYWRSFNIVGDEPLSDVSISRDFFNFPAQSNMADHKFIYNYNRLTEAWKQKYGWDLFLILSQEDEYNFKNLRIPITNSQPEFDQLVLSIVKTLIDSLNEKELKIGQDEGKKGISKLESWLIVNGITDYEEHIKFLRNLQELRSSGTGHRKGKSYTKISKVFDLDSKSRIDVFEGILNKASTFLEFMYDEFIVADRALN